MKNTVEKVCSSCKWFVWETDQNGKCFVHRGDMWCGLKCNCNCWESKIETVTDAEQQEKDNAEIVALLHEMKYELCSLCYLTGWCVTHWLKKKFVIENNLPEITLLSVLRQAKAKGWKP